MTHESVSGIDDEQSGYSAALHDRMVSLISWKQRATQSEIELRAARHAMIWFREHPYAALPFEKYPKEVQDALLSAQAYFKNEKP